ncbi:hypothetical protein [Nonomuraea salmonea]|uniref:hypothetical protein n=1 Tax=Nonomuraea salmonea TaxID=46181 RepID=UPI0031E5EBF6
MPSRPAPTCAGPWRPPTSSSCSTGAASSRSAPTMSRADGLYAELFRLRARYFV